MPRSNQGCGLLTALEELTYFLRATVCSRRDSHADVSKENILPFNTVKTNRKEGNNIDSRKGKKEGGRKDDRKQETTA